MNMTPLEASTHQYLSILDAQRPNSNLSALEVIDHARAFSQKTVRPLDDIAYKDNKFPHSLWAELGEAGLKGVIIPQEYGGSGLGNLDLCLTTMEIARASGAIAVSYVCDQALCSRQITTFGTEEQKSRFLASLSSGDSVGALAMSEPGAGSDVMRMQTRARKVDGGYKINGSKYWITNGGRPDNTDDLATAGTLVLYAKTDDTERITAFIVDGETDGFKVGSIIDKATTRGSDTAELLFEDCFVPDSCVLGEIGKGAHVLMAGLNVERLVFAANTIGVAQAAYEEVNDYLTSRVQFDMPVAYNQSVAFDLAEMFSQIDMAQKYLMSVGLQSDLNPQSLTNAVAASVFLQAANIAEEVTDKCQQLYGGYGQTTDCRIDRQRGVAALLQVGAGSKQMRLRRIAEQTIEGYEGHLRLNSALRGAYTRAKGQDYQDLDLVAAAKEAQNVSMSFN